MKYIKRTKTDIKENFLVQTIEVIIVIEVLVILKIPRTPLGLS